MEGGRTERREERWRRREVGREGGEVEKGKAGNGGGLEEGGGREERRNKWGEEEVRKGELEDRERGQHTLVAASNNSSFMFISV